MAYFLIGIVLDLVIAFFAFGATWAFWGTGAWELHGTVAMSCAAVLMLVINVCGIIKTRRGKKGIVGSAVAVKLGLFFAAVSVIYFTYETRNFMGVAFLFLTISLLCFGIGLAIPFIGSAKKQSTKQKKSAAQPKFEKPVFTAYKSKWAWNDAAAEYSLMTGKKPEEFSEEENDRIFDYASMPIIYFLTWLLRNNHMSEYFLSQTEVDEEALSSPLTFFCNMDYVLAADDIAEELRPFVDFYLSYEEKLFYDLQSNSFSFDYYEAIRNEKKFYYCVDFSWEVYEKLAAVIEKKWKRWKAHSEGEGPEEREAEIKVHSTLWNTDLSVTLTGQVSESYVRNCEACLNSMSEDEIVKACELLINTFGAQELVGEGDVKKVLQYFVPDEMVIFENEGEEDTAFCLLGESEEMEPEHGIALCIRNGYVLDEPCYRMDYDCPWDDSEREKYERAISDGAIRKVKSDEEVKTLLMEGKLEILDVPAQYLDEGNEKDATYYVTPHVKKLYDKAMIRLELLEMRGITVTRRVRFDFENQNPVPQSVSVYGQKDDRNPFREKIIVWR